MSEELNKLIELCKKYELTIVRFNFYRDMAVLEDKFGKPVRFNYTYKGEWE